MSTVSASIGLVHHAVDGLGEHARLADRELVAFAAHVLDEDREMQFAAAGDAEHVGVGGLVHAQRHVALAARACRRSRIWRLVTNLPSLPASGEVFTWKFMTSVGSSTEIGGSASGWSTSQIV